MPPKPEVASGEASGTLEQPRLVQISINIPLPSKLELSGNLATNWKKFHRAWNNYEIAARLKDPEHPAVNKSLRTATLLTCIGSDALDVYDGLDFESEEQKNDIDVVLQKLQRYCIGETNEIYERYKFNKRDQELNESVDAYVTALRTLAKTCNFGILEDSLIRDRIVIGVKDNQARKKLLQVSKLTLKECIDICRSYETTSHQLKEINQEEVHALQPSRDKNPDPPIKREIQCKFCTKTHAWNKLKCPAWGKTCSSCGMRNHFAVACQTKTPAKAEPPVKFPPSRHNRKPVYTVEDSDSDEYVACVDVKEQVCAVDNQYRKDKLLATMVLNDHQVQFQLDSGATVNILPEETFKQLYGEDSVPLLDNAEVTLIMYNKTEEKPLGKKRVRVVNPKNGKKYSVEFVVVKGNCKPLLGLRASEQMNLISVINENILSVQTQASLQDKARDLPTLTKEHILKEFADVFKGDGKLEGDLHLEIDPAVPPVQLPTRKVPIAIKEKLREELDCLEARNIVTPVNVPTAWISATVVTMKKNGNIRLCVDPKPLNLALKRNHYPLPTIEDVLPNLSNARCFTVLDAKNGFWHVTLDEESSYATTFGTPWGRYRWLRMPFGISPAPEEFQRRLDQALTGLEGCKAIADDILVFGCGATDEEATRDHDKNLTGLLERCKDKGIKLNSGKLQLRRKEVSYMGHMLSADGLKPDSEKVKAIREMPVPSDKQGVQRFLGMTNYLQKFAPKLSEITTPLRNLIKSDTEFLWDEQVHGVALNEAKRIISSTPVLKYFNPRTEPVLQCDASMHGLGACLMQNGQPVAFASRSLTPTEVQYAQIEKELLAIVFGMEKFETYLYGRKVLVETDHKPLESIFKKSLLNAPKRLQRMLLRLQRYEFEATYKRGTLLHMADALSRAYLPHMEVTGGQEDVLAVSDTRSPTEKEAEEINMLHYLPVREDTLRRIQECTHEDLVLKALANVIKQGWPESKPRLPPELQDYFPFKEELTLQNGVIFKGNRVVIPLEMRDELKRKLHSSHLGIQACQRRAREAFYWPGMYTEIEEHISKCPVCNAYQHKQQKEPMIQHPVPARPWQFIAADLFEFQGKEYLVTTDYHSNFFEVDKLSSQTSREVIDKLKCQMARHGIPDTLRSDNGPQFSSQEFMKFSELYEFDHITSSPAYPQSNGKAENSVKTAELIMLKALEAGTDPYLGLLDFRNTPTEGLGTSPAQRLFGRRTKTLLPTAGSLLNQADADQGKTAQLLQARKDRQSFYYNNGSKTLQPLEKGDVVRIQPTGTKKGQRWTQATVEGPAGVRSYQVTTEDGRVYRRNCRHLRLSAETPRPPLPDADTDNPEPEPLQAGQFPPEPNVPQAVVEPPPAPTSQDNVGRAPSPVKCSSSGRVLRRPAYLSDYAS